MTNHNDAAGLPLLPTSLVGSYAQPDWLIDRERLAGRFPPRVRATELWRVAPEWLEQAQDDATILAIRDQERAGLDIVTDGEMRRESYSNRFATALEGVDIDNPGTALDRSGHPNPVPRVVGPVRRKHPVEVRDLEFLKAHTDRTVKMTVPGPFTMSQQAQNDYYDSEEDLALDYAAAVNEEIRDLFAAGADIVQIDEPYMQARPAKAREFGLTALARAIDGVTGTVAIHICFGYAAIIHERPEGYSFLPELAGSGVAQISIETAQSNLDTSVLASLPGKTVILGVLDLNDPEVESGEVVAGRIRRALPYVPAERLVIAPDCGLKYLPRESAFGKMQAMVEGAALVRSELAGVAATTTQLRPENDIGRKIRDELFLIGRIVFSLMFLLYGVRHLTQTEASAGYAAYKKVPSPKIMVQFTGVAMIARSAGDHPRILDGPRGAGHRDLRHGCRLVHASVLGGRPMIRRDRSRWRNS